MVKIQKMYGHSDPRVGGRRREEPVVDKNLERILAVAGLDIKLFKILNDG